MDFLIIDTPLDKQSKVPNSNEYNSHHSSCAMLHNVVVCFICYVTLCGGLCMLCYVAIYCGMLSFVALCCSMLSYVVLILLLHYVVLCCAMLCYVVLC